MEISQDECRRWVERAKTQAANAVALFDEAKRLQKENTALRAEAERLREAAKIADEMYEQAATQANDYAAQRLETIANCERLVEQIKAEVERLREERRWIPVAEELPDDGEDVICAYADFESFAGFREGDVWFDQDAQWLKIPPTHWQPLPAPPDAG